MTKKTKQELQDELNLINLTKEIRIESDKLYAIKLVERIVFALVGLILLAVGTAIVAQVVK